MRPDRDGGTTAVTESESTLASLERGLDNL